MKKITKEHLESLIETIEYGHYGDTLTVCVLTLKNRFSVVGKTACIDKAMYDEAIGKQISYENAFEQLWELESYKQKGG